jgi:hypothetical protein
VLGIEHGELRYAAVWIQDTEIRTLVSDERRPVPASLDPNPGPRGELVGDLVDKCIRRRHDPIVAALGTAVRMGFMSDESIAARIESLVAEEHQLRSSEESDANDVEELSDDQRRLEEVQVELDRCWDLLRQRRALRDAGGDPDQAQVRDADTVERYWQ